MKTEPNEPINMGSQERKYGSEDQFTTTDFFEGLTKREHFSALAMQALITGVVSTGAYTIADINQGACCDIATVAVVCADQLIVELNKPTK